MSVYISHNEKEKTRLSYGMKNWLHAEFPRMITSTAIWTPSFVLFGIVRAYITAKLEHKCLTNLHFPLEHKMGVGLSDLEIGHVY